ncbi:hypothetical protein OJF2_14410 [Aquisphaera giovannonii]|uniref:Uncharacterized protein n=1 Tax=Aquisphaera giovannonii TaxID=406548 RepID=A0A5B9VYE6_9BACT|nr:hypothetical protein OJF2_14410 [Aquisphaera giovannonii]
MAVPARCPGFRNSRAQGRPTPPHRPCPVPAWASKASTPGSSEAPPTFPKSLTRRDESDPRGEAKARRRAGGPRTPEFWRMRGVCISLLECVAAMLPHAARFELFAGPQGQGSLRPTFFPTLRTGSFFFSVDRWLPAMAASWVSRMPPDDGAATAATSASADWWIVLARSSFHREPRYERNSGSKCSTRKMRSVARSAMPFHISAKIRIPSACTRPWGRSGRSPAGRWSSAGGPWRGGAPSRPRPGSGA